MGQAFHKHPYLDFRAVLHLFLLGDGVCHNYGLKAGTVDSSDGRPREDPMSEDGVNFGGSS